MGRRLLDFLWDNIGTLALAFALAFAVWISAVIAADPNEIRTLPDFTEIEVRNLGEGLVLLDELPPAVSIELGAPSSLWDSLLADPRLVTAYIDLAELTAGEHTLPVQFDFGVGPTRVLSSEPAEITLTLESRVTEEQTVSLETVGEVALGFEVGSIQLSQDRVTITGPSSLVGQIDHVRAVLGYGDERSDFSATLGLDAVDADGALISGLNLEPAEITVQVFIEQSGGYREVAVAVETLGQPAQGFRVIDITVDPPIVTLFSDDLQLIEALPGFVSTLPLDLSNAQEDIVSRLALNLPDGVSVEGDAQNVEVSIGISPIESSIPISVDAEVIGLATGFSFEVSPESANLILSGPLAVLQSLAPGDVRLIVDASSLEAGSHLVGPTVEILPEGLQVLSITPSSLEIIITLDSNP